MDTVRSAIAKRCSSGLTRRGEKRRQPKIGGMKRFDAVLFDFGHTLFNTKPAQACRVEFQKATAKDVDAEAFAQTWATILERSPRAGGDSQGARPSAAAHRRLWLELLAPLDQLAPDLAEFTYALECSARGWEPYPDTRQVLSELRRRGNPDWGRERLRLGHPRRVQRG